MARNNRCFIVLAETNAKTGGGALLAARLLSNRRLSRAPKAAPSLRSLTFYHPHAAHTVFPHHSYTLPSSQIARLPQPMVFVGVSPPTRALPVARLKAPRPSSRRPERRPTVDTLLLSSGCPSSHTPFSSSACSLALSLRAPSVPSCSLLTPPHCVCPSIAS